MGIFLPKFPRFLLQTRRSPIFSKVTQRFLKKNIYKFVFECPMLNLLVFLIQLFFGQKENKLVLQSRNSVKDAKAITILV